MIEVGYRRATEEDLLAAEFNFRDDFRVQHWAGPLAPFDRSTWNTFAMPQIRRILRDARTEVLVAYHPDRDLTPETRADIVGWLAWRPEGRNRPVHVTQGRSERQIVGGRASLPLVIYAYVKKHYRGEGVARGLFRHAGLDPWKDRYEYACRTDDLMARPKEGEPWDRPMVERMEHAQWNPRATRGGRRHGEEHNPDAERDRG